ncbi:MAG: DUF5777 family beta-barrel protein, partial [Saprospiraceae bacterium]
MKSYILILSIFISLNQFVFSQDLLSELGEETNPNQKVTNAFKSPRVINSHSMEMLAAGALDFRILHRFGNINEGYKQFFGLDNATMRMGFDYGITKNITVGLGR